VRGGRRPRGDVGSRRAISCSRPRRRPDSRQRSMSTARAASHVRSPGPVRPAFVPRTTGRRQGTTGMARAPNPQVRNQIRASLQLMRSTPRTLSRWRHGFEPRWDYKGKVAGQGTSHGSTAWLNRGSNAGYPANIPHRIERSEFATGRAHPPIRYRSAGFQGGQRNQRIGVLLRERGLLPVGHVHAGGSPRTPKRSHRVGVARWS
jgi:hypothetical protein